MNLEFSIQLIFLLQFFAFCQNSHMRHVKHHLRGKFSRAIPHVRPQYQAVYNRGSHYFHHYHAPSHNSRVHRVPDWRTAWTPRHKSNERQHYTRWSTWSQCNKDCITRRERFCRNKRKCSNIKHVEEKKCWNCILQPATTAMPTVVQSTQSPVIIINTPMEQRAHLQPLVIKHQHVYQDDQIDVDYAHDELYSNEDLMDNKQVFILKPHGRHNYDVVDSDEFDNYAHKKLYKRRRHRPRQRDNLKRRDLPQLHAAKNYGAIEGDIFHYEDFDFDQYHEEAYDDNQSSDFYDATLDANSSRLFPISRESRERSNIDALTLKHRRVYSKWSRWTKCSPKCTTSRYKKCRIRDICGREILREISYCYTEGSFCQQWLQAQVQVQKLTPFELRPAATHRRLNMSGDNSASNSDAALQSNAILRDVIMNGKGYMGPEYVPQKLKCGIPPIHLSNKAQRRRNMSNMLKIIGGKAARKGEWPWQVAVFNRFKEAFCGGTLIAPQWVLTAAHCVRKVLYVRLGEHNLDYEDGTELQLRVTKTFKHPNFDKKTVDSDVALLKLPKLVNTTFWIGFSCLPRPYQPLPSNNECTVIGWGKRRNRDVAGTNVLHQAEVPIIPMENCRLVYQDYTITKNMFCAGHKRGRIDTCAGDSGGPLLCRDITKPNHPWTIFGITSFGDGCAKRNKFGIYTKVPNYVDWVWSVINCNGNCKPH